jgi:hypothetical protein
VGKDYLTSSNTFVVSVDLATFATNDDNQSANELQHWRKQKQLPHQRDPYVATDYYIQSTEKRTHVRLGRRKEIVKSMSSSSSQSRDLL